MDDSVTRAALARKGSPYLNTAQAAHYLGVCARTLERMRKSGGGPAFSYHGKAARYHIDDLIAWLKQHRGPPSDHASVHAYVSPNTAA
jgi:hypothetical protein